ncbi:hypothetical protein BC829DRAFT_157505 [Chytridium lagenaria]|nr:hypothetical protein BC829DRAFT_157505 [Chytridium lagenaria]
MTSDSDFTKPILQLTRFGYETVVIHGRNIKDTFLNCANETYMWDDILKLGGQQHDQKLFSAQYTSAAISYSSLRSAKVSPVSSKRTVEPSRERSVSAIPAPVTAKVTEPAQVGTSTPKSNPIKSYDVLLDAIHALQESLPSGIVTLSSIKNLIDDAACQDEGYASLGQYVVAAWEARVVEVLPYDKDQNDMIVKLTNV